MAAGIALLVSLRHEERSRRRARDRNLEADRHSVTATAAGDADRGKPGQAVQPGEDCKELGERIGRSADDLRFLSERGRGDRHRRADQHIVLKHCRADACSQQGLAPIGLDVVLSREFPIG